MLELKNGRNKSLVLDKNFAEQIYQLAQSKYDFARIAYPSKERRLLIGPDTHCCMYVAPAAEELLVASGFRAKQVLFGENLIEHAFVKVVGNHQYVIDGQYRQFVDEDKRSQFPAIMVFPFESTDDVIVGLNAHGVPDRRHHLYTDSLPWA